MYAKVIYTVNLEKLSSTVICFQWRYLIIKNPKLLCTAYITSYWAHQRLNLVELEPCIKIIWVGIDLRDALVKNGKQVTGLLPAPVPMMADIANGLWHFPMLAQNPTPHSAPESSPGFKLALTEKPSHHLSSISPPYQMRKHTWITLTNIISTTHRKIRILFSR